MVRRDNDLGPCLGRDSADRLTHTPRWPPFAAIAVGPAQKLIDRNPS